MLTFKILGPLEVVRDGESLPLGAAKQRALIACLLLHPNEAVSTDRLIDELWGQEAPSSAEHMLHVYVSRLRKILEGQGEQVLVTRAPGYLIQLGEGDVLDSAQFEALVRRVRGVAREDPAEALDLLERALGMWRGPALADFAYEAFAQGPAGRMEELRAVAEEERAGALLALGRHQDAIPELDSLVTRYPLREHLRAQQMLALYRAGRQADALAAFQAARQTLAAELGVDPGPELRSLEEAVLRHDPGLRAEPSRPPEAASTAGGRGPPEAGPSRRRRATVAVGGALLVLVVAVAALISRSTSTDEGTLAGASATDSATGSVPGSATGTLQLRWTEAGSDDLRGPGDQKILGAARTPSGYLAFGYTTVPSTDPTGEPDLDAALWQGTPGDWTMISSASPPASGNQRVTDAVVFRSGIVLVGSDESEGDFDAAVWVSSGDPGVWSRSDPLSAGLRKQQDQFIRAVAVIKPRLIAVGSGGDDAGVWRSENGNKWVFLQGGVPTEAGKQQMATLVRSQPIVAGGYSDVDGDRDAAIWISRDGGFWRRILGDEDLGGPASQQINSMTLGGPGFVAVGEETIGDDTNAVVWTSSDGREWERVADPSSVFGGEGDQRMFAVASSALGLVAAGADDDGLDVDGAVWTSLDGTTWQRLPKDSPAMSALTDIGDQDIKVLIPVESGFLALGAERGATDYDADAWIGEPTP